MDEDRIYLDGERIRERTIPLVSTLPLFPPVKAAMMAVEAVLRRDFNVTSDEARERIRVEVTPEVEMELRRLISASNLHLVHDPRGSTGPMKVMGVSFYRVHNLPEPGWRVIGAPSI